MICKPPSLIPPDGREGHRRHATWSRWFRYPPVWAQPRPAIPNSRAGDEAQRRFPLPRRGQAVYNGSVQAWTAERHERTVAEERHMEYRPAFTAMLAIWALGLGIDALAQGIPAPAPGALPALQDAVLLRSKTLFE